MSSRHLTDLAPELLIEVFKLSHSFADAISLSSTRRSFFSIWETNSHVICDVILKRTVPCFAQAQDVLDAMQKSEGGEHSVFGHQSAVYRAQLMLKGAENAAKALNNFQNEVFDLWTQTEPTIERKTLTAAERTDFIQAYYRASTLTLLGKGSMSFRLLSYWDILDLEQVRDVIRWVISNCCQDYWQELGIESNSNPTPTGKEKRFLNWLDFIRFANGINWILFGLPKNPDKSIKSDAPFSPFVVRSRYPEQCRSNRGARLAEVLPRITRKQGRRLFPAEWPANNSARHEFNPLK